jgi:hypothetical protein
VSSTACVSGEKEGKREKETAIHLFAKSMLRERCTRSLAWQEHREIGFESQVDLHREGREALPRDASQHEAHEHNLVSLCEER